MSGAARSLAILRISRHPLIGAGPIALRAQICALIAEGRRRTDLTGGLELGATSLVVTDERGSESLLCSSREKVDLPTPARPRIETTTGVVRLERLFMSGYTGTRSVVHNGSAA